MSVSRNIRKYSNGIDCILVCNCHTSDESFIILCSSSCTHPLTHVLSLVLPLSLLECHSRFHDPLCHVMLCWHHRWNPLLCPLLGLWEVQPLVCCWHHVLCFKWVVAAIETCVAEMFEVTVTDVDFNMCHSLPTMPALFVLLAMAIYTGVTVNFLGKRFGDWRFSWSYILGWVALLMTFFAGLFKSRSAVEFSVIFLPLVNKINYVVIANWGTHKIIKSPIQCCHIFLKFYLRSFLKLLIVSLCNLIRIALIKVPTVYF